MTGNLFDMPDGELVQLAVQQPAITVRLYDVSSNGLTLTWNKDIIIPSSWNTDNHGFASDGRFLVLLSYNGGGALCL